MGKGRPGIGVLDERLVEERRPAGAPLGTKVTWQPRTHRDEVVILVAKRGVGVNVHDRLQGAVGPSLGHGDVVDARREAGDTRVGVVLLAGVGLCRTWPAT